MTFHADHLSDAQLAGLISGELKDVGMEFHLRQCMECKRAMGR